MNNSIAFRTYRGWVVVLITLLLTISISCSDSDSPGQSDDKYVNDWILENMQYWYYWENELPTSPDKNTDPSSFFESLLADDDRFSWIQENYIDLLNSLQGINKEAGFEFVLYRESQ